MTVTLYTLDHPRGLPGATLLEEGALQVVFEHGGQRAAVASHRVMRVVREGDERERELWALEALLARGEWRAVETRADALLRTPRLPEWAAARAAGSLAAARLLRARLEGQGASQALAAWERAAALTGQGRLAARAALGVGEAALLAGRHERAREAFARLAEGDLSALHPWRWLGRLGLLRVQVAAGELAPAVAALVRLEQEAGEDPAGVEAAMLARVVRAEALVGLGRHRAAAEVLEPVREDPSWAGSPVLPRALNALAAIYLATGGQRPDGTWKPEGVLAGLPLRLRLVRYAQTDAVERARALAGAVAGLRLTGQAELADMMQAELEARFPGAAATRELTPPGRGLGD